MAGSFYTNSLTLHAFLYNGIFHDIGTLGASYLKSDARGINNVGLVTGSSDTGGNYCFDADNCAPATHAFIYDGTMHDLGTLQGPNGYYSEGSAINNSGWVTGEASTATLEKHAFLYDGTMHDLGTLGRDSSGNALNSSGTVVGEYYLTGSTDFHAFIYKTGDGMIDLNSLIDTSLGWKLRTATGINDSGQITGWSIIDGQTRAFLLSPVPEPSTITLLVVATFVFAWRAHNSAMLRNAK